MKLICRKCDKEVEGYSVEYSNHGHYLSALMRVVCHGEVSKKHIAAAYDGFNPSDYGSISFFEKEEPKTPSPVVVAQRDASQASQIKMLQEELNLLNKYHDKSVGMNNTMQKEIESLESENNDFLNENLGLKERIECMQDEITCLQRWRNHLPSPLTWTKEKPTEGGKWYWRNNNVGEKSVVFVDMAIPYNDPLTYSQQLCVIQFDEPNRPLSRLLGEWAGPIPEPV